MREKTVERSSREGGRLVLVKMENLHGQTVPDLSREQTRSCFPLKSKFQFLLAPLFIGAQLILKTLPSQPRRAF